MEKKRVFFGLEVTAPWPEELPAGRMIEAKRRHLTLAFLGDVDCASLLKSLPKMPLPAFEVGFVGKFDEIMLLPRAAQPHVVSWRVCWLENVELLIAYQQQLSLWSVSEGFVGKAEKNWLPHVTLCRQPFQPQQWRENFQPLPLVCQTLHLYESTGSLHYEPLWSLSLQAPFEEIEHTADIAFILRATTMAGLYAHAQAALAFDFPALLPYLQFSSLMATEIKTTEDIVLALNAIIAIADGQIGVPFKAISFHGKLKQEGSLLAWEMIVDV